MNSPKLYFVYGCMGSAKTAHLLMREFNYRERGFKTIVFTSGIDDRAGIGVVKSRIGLEIEAVPIFWHSDIFDCSKRSEADVIFVDEAQFLTIKQVKDLARVVDSLGKTVYCYGLRGDFLGRPFEGSGFLMSLADTIEELKTTCNCGRKAIINARIIDGKIVFEGDQVQIGGNESYQAMCRKCWLSAESVEKV